MGIEAQLKDCPSCGSAIAESAVKCTVCKSGLGHCVGCDAWIVVGTQCFDCGKSTAIRVRRAAAAAEREPAMVRFDASPIPLLPLLFIRFVLTAACGGAIVLAVAASPFGAVAKYFTDRGVPSAGGWPVLWGAAAMLHLAAGFSGTLIRRFRVSRTTLQGQAVEVTLRPGLVILDLAITVLVMALTAGLGLPWLFARYRRSFYRSCRLPARGGINLGFQGSGEEVLGRFFLTLVLLPFALLTGGLVFGVISWIWLKWDHANLLVPDKYGTLRPVAFRGTMGAYLGRWTVGWLLTLVTAGIYRPWARIAEWRWAAEQTDLR